MARCSVARNDFECCMLQFDKLSEVATRGTMLSLLLMMRWPWRCKLTCNSVGPLVHCCKTRCDCAWNSSRHWQAIVILKRRQRKVARQTTNCGWDWQRTIDCARPTGSTMDKDDHFQNSRLVVARMKIFERRYKSLKITAKQWNNQQTFWK